jgi:hypothetical protein
VPSCTLDWLDFAIGVTTAQDRKRAKSLILLVMWVIWKERNRRIFDSKDRPVHIIVAEIADELAVWELARGRQLAPQE